MTRSPRLLVLARQAVIPLMLLESADVALEKSLRTDLVPRAWDLLLCALVLSSGVLVLVLEAVERKVRRASQVEDMAPARRRDDELHEASLRHRRRSRVERVLEGNDFPRMVFQPIVDVQSETVAGYEALSRFSVGRPDEWFSEAAAVGLGLELELKAIRRALRSLDSLPPAMYLSVNASPQTLASERMRELLGGLDLRRVVVELTAPVTMNDYESVCRALAHFRARGGRLAMDDLGGDQTSLRRIATLEPDIIKLDRSLTRALSTDGRERSIVTALVGVGHAAGATIVAEGLEDETGLLVARDLGVHAAQGWLLGRPLPLSRLGEASNLPVRAVVPPPTRTAPDLGPVAS